MDHDPIHQVLSPGEKYELNQELPQFDENQENHFHFQENENPFSYYNNEQGDRHAGEEEQETHLQQELDHADAHIHHNSNAESAFQKVEVMQPTHIPPIRMPSPKQEDNPAPAPPPNVTSLKETAFDLSKIKPQPSPASEHQNQNQKQLESKYQQQLADDLEGLRNSVKAKDRKKFKIFDSPKEQPPKSNLNKTFAHTGKSRHLNQSELQMEEMRMLVKMAFEKKKANYEMLKEWDRKRAEGLALHGRVVELLQGEVDQRIKCSLENFESYQAFFREKAQQEEKYVGSPVINTRHALQGNSLSRNVYINCTLILNSLSDENTARCRRISDFLLLIRTTILKELTEAHLASSQKELLLVREKISVLKGAMKRYNQETEEKTVELGTLFKEQAGNITGKTEQDFYRTQLSFLRKAIQQTEVQKKLGQYCLEYYHTAVQEELKRGSVIREAMQVFARGLKATYGLGEITEEHAGKHEELRLIEEYFALEDMFDQRTLELLKARTHSSELTIDSFSAYINGFNHEPFDSRIILLKEFWVKLQGLGKEKVEESCYLVITVDNFLHLTVTQGQGPCCKPDITIKINAKTLEVRAGKDESVEIILRGERRSSMMSYFWESKADKAYRVRFAKKDNREEFMDYIGKLMASNY